MSDIIRLRPNADNSPLEWNSIATDHYDSIDEPLGSEPDAKYLWVDKDDLPGDEDRWDFETQSTNVLFVIQVDVAMFGALWQGPLGFNHHIGDIYLGSWLGQKTWDDWDDLSWKWQVHSWTGLQGSQTELNNLVVAAITPVFDEAADQIRIESVYVDVYIIWQECGRKINRRVNGRINDGLN